MDFADFDEVAHMRAAEITRDLLARFEDNEELLSLLQLAALLGFVAGCQHGSQVGPTIYGMPEGVTH